MTKPSVNVSYEYLFARLHGLWMKSVHGEVLQTLAKAGSTEALAHLAHDVGLEGAEDRTNFHKQLILRENRTLEKVCMLLEGSLADYYRAFLRRAYYENLKMLIHYHHFPAGDTPVAYLLTDVSDWPKVNMAKALQARGTEEFISQLNLREHKEEIEAIIRRLAADKDIMAADCALDSIVYNDLLLAARTLEQPMREEALALVGEELDIINLTTILRNVTTYHLDSEKLAGYCLKGGALLVERQLKELSRQETRGGILGKLPSHYARVLSPLSQGELYVMENALWCDLYARVRKLFINFNTPEYTIVAFPFLKHFESLNISRIYEGIHFGLPARELLGMLIE